MTPFVETARQLILGLSWHDQPPAFVHNGRTLTWRHHGLGMLQAELSETLRIHIWHPRLVSVGMAWPRCVHDHRFDITSAVVLGAVRDVVPDIRKGHEATHPSGGWQRAKMYEIEHAKNQDRMVLEKGCSTATSAKFLNDVTLTRLYTDKTYAADSTYQIPRRVFHTTEINELALTVVHRSNFDDRLARVLCAPESDVTAVSGIVRDDSPAEPGWKTSLERKILIHWVLREAAAAMFLKMGSAP
jgi:hypothetical protein